MNDSHLLPNAARVHDDAAYYFLHIPKTAGTTLNSYLRSLFNDFETNHGWDWHRLLELDDAQLITKRFFSGHFGAYIHHHVRQPLRYFTFLRDPVKRAVSHYSHILRDSRHYFHAKTSAMRGFSEYIRDPETQSTVSNFQLRMLAMDIDPRSHSRDFTRAELESLQLERAIDTFVPPEGCAKLLEVARRRLPQFCFVGVTEMMEQSLDLLCETFAWPRPPQLPRLNVDPNDSALSALGADDLKFLQALNEEEIELYQGVRRDIERQFATAKKKIFGFASQLSFAQNREDVLLARVFAGIEQGSYIDVGAHHPVADSVTHHFYSKGWRGVNIEPVPSLFPEFLKQRTRDVNLNCAAAAEDGVLTFFEVEGTGLSTLKREVSSVHQAAGFNVTETKVPCTTLDAIWQEHVRDDVHFLKIDVEGAEADVLRGLDLHRYRPWVLVVESTIPNTSISNHGEWEALITAANYTFASFDGLNRYYVSPAHLDLLPRFSPPPNVLDGFADHRHIEEIVQARLLRAQLRKAASLNEHLRASSDTELSNIREYLATVVERAERAEAFATDQTDELGRARAELQQIVAAYEAHQASAHAQLDAVHSEFDSARRYAWLLESEIDLVRSELTRIQAAREAETRGAVESMAALRVAVEVAESYARVQSDSLAVAQEELAQVQRRSEDEARRAQDYLHGQANELERARGELERIQVARESESQSAQEYVATLQAALNDAESYVLSQSAALAAAQVELACLQSRSEDDAQRAARHLQAQAAELERTRSELERLQAARQIELQAAEEYVASLRDAAKDAESYAVAQTIALAQLHERLSELQRRHDDLEQSATAYVQSQESELDRLRNELDRIRGARELELVAADKYVAALRAAVTDAESYALAQSAALSKAHQQVDDLRLQLTKATQLQAEQLAIHDARAQKAERDAHVKTGELANTVATLTELQSLYSRDMHANQLALVERDAMQVELESRNALLVEHADALNKDLENLRAQLVHQKLINLKLDGALRTRREHWSGRIFELSTRIKKSKNQ